MLMKFINQKKSDFKTLEDKNIKQYIHLLNHFMNIKTIF
ncbi:hypothetical protein ECF_04874 [Escherichia coli O157:H7 str. 1125]|nr:hypothetical protein ECF_04874 [Escherichia coli O157:H7 str. 1125]